MSPVSRWVLAGCIIGAAGVAAAQGAFAPGGGPGPGMQGAGPSASAPGVGMGPGGMGPGMGRGRGAQYGPDYSPGWSMMTPEERSQHQATMGSMSSYDGCRAYVAQQHEQMAARAKAQGAQVPAQPRRDACAGLRP